MGDFETVPASSLPEKPEEEKKEEEKKAEEKPVVEAVDWDSDVPAEEPKFAAVAEEDATRVVPPPQPAHTVEAKDEVDVIEPAQVLPPAGGEPPKKSKTWLIILIVALVLLCLCCVVVVVIVAATGALGSLNMNQYFQVPGLFPV